MRIALISCVKLKLNHKACAKDLYISSLFRKIYIYIYKHIKPDKIFILSAKYGLLEESDIIEPYNETLKEKNEHDKKVWAYNVIVSMKSKKIDLEKDEFYIFAGLEYRKYLCQKIKNYNIPLKGLSIGNQLKFLKLNT